MAYKKEVGRQLRWRSSRYNYVGFKNVVAQLKICNPGLNVSGICPNKLVVGNSIRDPQKSYSALKISPMLENFECDDYSFEEDPNFPWFSDWDAASSDGDGGETVGMEGSGGQDVKNVETAEDANEGADDAANECGPPVA